MTNKGIGGLLKKWGEGASLVRGQWKERDNGDGEDEVSTPKQSPRNDVDIDELADSMDALRLVPPSIRFGRGGKAGGFRRNRK